MKHHKDPIFMSYDVASTLSRRYPAEDAALSEHNEFSRVIGFFQVAQDEYRKILCSEGALALITN